MRNATPQSLVIGATVASVLFCSSVQATTPNLNLERLQYPAGHVLRVQSRDDKPIKILRIILNKQRNNDWCDTISGKYAGINGVPVTLHFGGYTEIAGYMQDQCRDIIYVEIQTDQGWTSYNW
jgi:hypothetical protein